jgi:hypothetical protein
MGNTEFIPTSADPMTDVSASPVAPTTDVSALTTPTTDVGTPAAPTTDIGETSNNTVDKSLSRNEEYTACVEFFTRDEHEASQLVIRLASSLARRGEAAIVRLLTTRGEASLQSNSYEASGPWPQLARLVLRASPSCRYVEN